jgi:CTP synthase
VNCGLDIGWIEASDVEKVYDAAEMLSPYDGILVPGGFGERGIEGKIKAIKYARENKVPYLGLCLGLQLMVVEYARNVCGLKEAHSTEFNRNTPHPVIDLLPEQHNIRRMGATMRLGSYECLLRKGTLAHKAYGADTATERHRHRYEVNPAYVGELEARGLVVSGVHHTNIVEIVEWKDSFGIATQPHIELKSRLEAPAPIFVEFMKAAKDYRENPAKSAGEEIAD